MIMSDIFFDEDIGHVVNLILLSDIKCKGSSIMQLEREARFNF